jgi:hypothetical protein
MTSKENQNLRHFIEIHHESWHFWAIGFFQNRAISAISVRHLPLEHGPPTAPAVWETLKASRSPSAVIENV